MPLTPDLLLDLCTALAIGLLIGAERGWSARSTRDERLTAGLRTYGLLGLLGGLGLLLGQTLGIGVWIALLLAMSALIITTYITGLRRDPDQGITSEIALLLTFLLGSLALADARLLAAGCAVVVALLLRLKEPLHRALHRLSAEELGAALKLLFISLVLLPVLPNQGYGPWQLFNPYVLWWMVVALSAMGFAAYVAVRLVGARHGLLLTAVLGSLVSSTATTLLLARLQRRELQALLSAGLLLTSALMFPRVLLEVAVFNPALVAPLLVPALACLGGYLAGALYWWWRSGHEVASGSEPLFKNPCELGAALRFALLLALILLLVEVAHRQLGAPGVYLVALFAGVADVDAIALSLARSAQGELDSTVAVQGIAIAAASNSLFKALLILLAGGRALALRTLPWIVASLLLGGLLLIGS